MKLSVITINLNNIIGLQKTIESVISQTFKDFEWIVIDGGSTDGSKELIEKYADHISYWVSEPDKGIYNAMNKGIHVAKGEYIEFLNSGDIYFNEKTLENVNRHLSNSDIIYGSAIIRRDGKDIRIHMQRDICSFYDLVKKPINHQSSFIKKELFEKYGNFDENFSGVEDTEFLYRIKRKGISINHIIPKVFYVRRIHGKNVTLNYNQDTVKYITAILRKGVK
jgi:glycosyltransferase involved in cell wall biosynthesis